MALNDLLKGFKRMALRGALGLALVSPMVQGCGDEGDTNNYYGDTDTNNGVENNYSCTDFCDYVFGCQKSDPSETEWLNCKNYTCPAQNLSQNCISCAISLSCTDILKIVNKDKKFSDYCNACNF